MYLLCGMERFAALAVGSQDTEGLVETDYSVKALHLAQLSIITGISTRVPDALRPQMSCLLFWRPVVATKKSPEKLFWQISKEHTTNMRNQRQK